MVVLGAGTLGSTEILLRSRANGLRVSDRLGAALLGQRRHHRLRLRRAALPVNAVGVGHPAKIDGIGGRRRRLRQLEIDDATMLANELRVQEGVLPSALAPVLPVMFLPNGRLLGALQSLVNGVYKGPFAKPADVLCRVARQRLGPLLARRRPARRSPGRTPRTSPSTRVSTRCSTAIVNAAGGRYVKNPLAGTVMGHQPATAHPLGGCGMGRDRGDGRRRSQGAGVRAGGGRGPTAVHEGLYVVDGAVIPRSLGVNPLLHDHGARRAHAAAHGAGLRPFLRRRTAHRRARDAAGSQSLLGGVSRTGGRPGSRRSAQALFLKCAASSRPLVASPAL